MGPPLHGEWIADFELTDRRAGGVMTQELAEAYSRYVYEHAASEVLVNESWGSLPDLPMFLPVDGRPILLFLAFPRGITAGIGRSIP